MNVQPGDLAVIVRNGFEENIGRIVSVIRQVTMSAWPDVICWHVTSEGASLRGMAPITYTHSTCIEGAIPDFCLRPIRPSDEPDEMARIVPLSREVTA